MTNATSLAAPNAGLTLRTVLHLDAATCVLTGALLVGLTSMLAGLFGLPEALLRWAGLVLFPCGALMALAARTQARALVTLVILGNVAWVLASIVVAVIFEPTALGLVFVIAQALVVAALAWLERRAAR